MARPADQSGLPHHFDEHSLPFLKNPACGELPKFSPELRLSKIRRA
jgi:hypothetical protein